MPIISLSIIRPKPSGSSNVSKFSFNVDLNTPFDDSNSISHDNAIRNFSYRSFGFPENLPSLFDSVGNLNVELNSESLILEIGFIDFLIPDQDNIRTGLELTIVYNISEKNTSNLRRDDLSSVFNFLIQEFPQEFNLPGSKVLYDDNLSNYLINTLGQIDIFVNNDQIVEVNLEKTTTEIEISLDDFTTVVEGNTGQRSLDFLLTLNISSDQTINIDYNTINDTAIAGSDYISTSGTLTFQPGETQKTISVAILGDTEVESEEQFFLNINNTQIIGKISNDDFDDNNNSLDTQLYRFSNNFIPGTYLFVTEGERESIKANYYDIFEEEGAAFKVANQHGDNLIQFNRFANLNVPGTYLYANEEESISIRSNFSHVFSEEGIAFYAYSGDAGIGTDYYRMSNTEVSGTYIFVNEFEKNQILANFPQLFVNEGIAFEVG